jgi:hypothetical protein
VPIISASTREAVTTILTHTGLFDATTRANPTLAFFEKYINSLETLDFANQFPDFYAPNCTFYNENGTILIGGPTIAAFIDDLFAPFGKIEVNNHVHRVFPFRASPALGDEGAVGSRQDGVDAACGDACTWMLNEHDFVFYLKPPLDGPGIPARRAIHFLAGPAQVEGQGTDGLQWYEVSQGVVG